MKIVVDENIAHAADAFAEFGQVVLVPGRSISRKELPDADALIIRSVTPVSRELLDGTPIRFVGTATIGVDHIDQEYLAEAGIGFVSAAEAGRRAVAEYVLTALFALHRENPDRLCEQKLGLVGVGNIGSTVSELARGIGIPVVEYDPPRSVADRSFESASASELFSCDIISLSVPLVPAGPHPTRHMVDAAFLERMKETSLLINTARGGVVDSVDLQTALANYAIRTAVLDVWEGEPDVPVDLLQHCALATPHIAGYSFDGKVKGTELMVKGLAEFLGKEADWNGESLTAERAGRVRVSGSTPLQKIASILPTVFDIAADSQDLSALFSVPADERRTGFDRLRRDYHLRREFGAWEVEEDDAETTGMLARLGFRVI